MSGLAASRRARAGATVLCGALAALLFAGPAADAQAPATPGAETMSVHGDWQVRCAGADGACIARQERTSGSGERLLAVEIAPAAADRFAGTALLPFGTLFDAGVAIRIDGDAALGPLAFRTCLPQGCLLTFEIDGTMLERMRRGTAFAFDLTTIGGEPVELPVSLAGFTAATNRLAESAAVR